MSNVRIFKATHDFDKRIDLPNVAEEFITQSFPLRGAFDESGYVYKFNSGRDKIADFGDLAQLGQAWIGNSDNSQVGFNCAEGIILGGCLVGLSNRVEKRGFPNIRQSDNPGL